MKVLQIIPYMAAVAGGPPIVVEKLIRLLPLFGWESVVLTTSIYHDDQSDLFHSSAKDGKIIMLKKRSPWSYLINRYKESISQLSKDADIIHIHTLWHPLNTIVRDACVQRQLPYVVMPHGMLEPMALAEKRFKKKIYLKLAERKNIMNARRIIYTSSEEKRLSEESIRGLPKGVIVPLGTDFPGRRKESLRTQFLEQFPSLRGKRVILFLSRIHQKKGLEILIDSFHAISGEIKEAVLLIVGSGEEQYRKSLEKRVRYHNIEDKVIFAGMLLGDMKWGAYAVADVFVLPSKQENFAIVVAEAMGMGLPVVITDRVNSSSHVKDAEAGIIVPYDEGLSIGIAEAITQILQNQVLAAQFGENGAGYARRILTWENAASMMAGIYNNVLSEISAINKS